MGGWVDGWGGGSAPTKTISASSLPLPAHFQRRLLDPARQYLALLKSSPAMCWGLRETSPPWPVVATRALMRSTPRSGSVRLNPSTVTTPGLAAVAGPDKAYTW